MPEAKPGKSPSVLSFVGVLVAAVLAVQAVAIVMVFWSRFTFGYRFDPVVFSEFETVRSTESVNDTLGLRRAEAARRQARQPVRDGVTLAMEKADRERAHARLRDEENSSIRGEAERDAANLTAKGEGLLLAGQRTQAFEAFESALKRLPGHLPAVRRLAALYEELGLASQARFLWEKMASATGDHGAATAEIQANLKRLAGVDDAIRRVGEKPPALGAPLRPSDFPASPAQAPHLRLLSVTRVDLPLEDMYDLRFRMEFVLDAEGFVGPIEISGVRMEVVFFDHSLGTDGAPRPIRVLTFPLQPRREWMAGEKQTLSLNYSVPRGYFRTKAMRYGNGYAYHGVVVKLYYRGEVQDRFSDPPSLATDAGPG